jgi:hypothetical protein
MNTQNIYEEWKNRGLKEFQDMSEEEPDVGGLSDEEGLSTLEEAWSRLGHKPGYDFPRFKWYMETPKKGSVQYGTITLLPPDPQFSTGCAMCEIGKGMEYGGKVSWRWGTNLLNPSDIVLMVDGLKRGKSFKWFYMEHHPLKGQIYELNTKRSQGVASHMKRWMCPDV